MPFDASLKVSTSLQCALNLEYVKRATISWENDKRIIGVVGASGSLLDPGGNIVTHYSWGLRVTSNNTAEAYALLQGLSIAKERNVTKLVIFGDSMMVIRMVTNITQSGGNLFNGIINRIINLSKIFDEFKLFHIK
jgi:ribonuclease HI